MAESNRGKMCHSRDQSSKIPDFLTAMVAGSYDIHEASRNLSQLQEQIPKAKWVSHIAASHDRLHHKAEVTPAELYARQPYHHSPHVKQEDWGMYPPWSSLSQCMPIDSPKHHQAPVIAYYPVTEAPDCMYGRCSTPDIIQTVLQMDSHDASPIGKQMSPGSLPQSPTSLSSPVMSPCASIWRSPGGREYMDSGYLSEDSLHSLSSCVYQSKTKETSPQIPSFASSFYTVTSKQKSESHATNGVKLSPSINQATPGTTRLSHCVAATPSHQPYPLASCESGTPIQVSQVAPKISTGTPIQISQVAPKISTGTPIQVSQVTSKISTVHIKHPKQTSPQIASVNIQSAEVSTSIENLPRVEADVKPQCKPSKRKRSDAKSADDVSYKRGRHNEPLNHRAIMIMVDWYNEHEENPYPNKQEKLRMATEGGITVSQVKSWFANKRNRSNNTRPKVEKQHLQERLLTICQSLSKEGLSKSMDNSFVIQQLSSLISSSKQ